MPTGKTWALRWREEVPPRAVTDLSLKARPLPPGPELLTTPLPRGMWHPVGHRPNRLIFYWSVYRKKTAQHGSCEFQVYLGIY